MNLNDPPNVFFCFFLFEQVQLSRNHRFHLTSPHLFILRGELKAKPR